MAWVTSKVKIYTPRLKAIDAAARRSLEKTGEELRTEVVQAQVMPRDNGHMQNESTEADTSRSAMGVVTLTTQTSYARRLYFHPEYNFSKVENPHAQGRWLEPWISGDKKDWCRKTFAQFMKMEGGGV